MGRPTEARGVVSRVSTEGAPAMGLAGLADGAAAGRDAAAAAADATLELDAAAADDAATLEPDTAAADDAAMQTTDGGPGVDAAIDLEGVAPGIAAGAAGAAGEGDPVAVLARAGGFIARQVAELIDEAERADGQLDKSRVEALTALARMMERWEALARYQASQDEDCSDAELAEFLRRVDERIVELAALEARRLVAAGYRPPPDA